MSQKLNLNKEFVASSEFSNTLHVIVYIKKKPQMISELLHHFPVKEMTLKVQSCKSEKY